METKKEVCTGTGSRKYLIITNARLSTMRLMLYWEVMTMIIGLTL